MKRPAAPVASKDPTVHDVAERARVAVGTVSRYLNGQVLRGGNKERIERAIADLAFVPSNAASSIRRARSNFVGFILPSFDEYHAAVIRRVTQLMLARGYVVLPYYAEEMEIDAEKIVAFFRSFKIESLIVSGDINLARQFDVLKQLDVPIIIYNNDIYGIEVDRIRLNDRKVTETAVSYLLGMNHRSIGFIRGTAGDSTAEERLAGYAQAMESAGLGRHADRHLFGNGWTEQHGYLAMLEMWNAAERPTAVFCSNYLQALGVLKFLHEMNVRVPDDISLISFGDTPYFSYIGKGITAIRIPDEQIANSVVFLFFSRIEDEATPLTRTITHECDFILRGSVASHRGEIRQE